jgi:hypothetical protein
MAFLAYNNRLFDYGTWTDNGSAFAATPPIANMGTPQVPTPHAEFEGATADFQFAALDESDAAENFTARVVALLGHNLPDGATITFKDEGGTTIGSATVSRFKNRPNNTIVVLSADQTINTLEVEIASANAGTNRIAAVWASEAWEFDLVRDQRYRAQSAGSVTRISGTDWPFSDTRRRGIPVTARGTMQEILGIDLDGNELSGNDAETVLQDARHYGPAIVIPTTITDAAIHATSIYGLIDSAGDAEYVGGDIWNMTFDVVESR